MAGRKPSTCPKKAESNVLPTLLEVGELACKDAVAKTLPPPMFAPAGSNPMPALGDGDITLYHTDPKELFALGLKYYKGDGVPQSDTEAVKWYRLAAEQGNALAQYNLGWMYQYGRGVKKSRKTAIMWYEKAAAQGDTGVNARLAELR